jgi:hypothetical protein
MNVVKKVASVVALILSVLFLLVFLAGTVGVWIVRSDAIQIGNEVAAAVDNILVEGQALADRVSSRVDVTQGRISTGVGLIEAAGTKAEQTPIVLNLVQQLLDKDLTPAVEGIKDSVGTLRDAVGVASQTVSLMQRLPGSRDSEVLAGADEAIQKLQAVDQRLQDANQAARDAKSNTIGNITDTLVAPLNSVGAALTDVQTAVQEVNNRLVQAQARVQEIHNTYNMAVTGIALGMTIVFLWLALSQVALFIWAYRGLTGRDLLARKPKKEEPALAPVA